jgi:hypothetical protein
VLQILDRPAWRTRPRSPIPAARQRRYPEHMTTPAEHQPAGGADDLLAAAGIEVTEEGKQRARDRRHEAERRWTPEQWAALAAQLGLPPRAAA